MSRFRTLLVGGALALAALSPRLAAAQQPLAFGIWEPFEWLNGEGPVEGLGFGVASLLETRVRVTDAFFSGDAFDVFVNGVLTPRAQTPLVADGEGSADVSTGDQAWAHPALSRVEFLLGPGRT
jgi:hypothetical protein